MIVRISCWQVANGGRLDELVPQRHVKLSFQVAIHPANKCSVPQRHRRRSPTASEFCRRHWFRWKSLSFDLSAIFLDFPQFSELKSIRPRRPPNTCENLEFIDQSNLHLLPKKPSTDEKNKLTVSQDFLERLESSKSSSLTGLRDGCGIPSADWAAGGRRRNIWSVHPCSCGDRVVECHRHCANATNTEVPVRWRCTRRSLAASYRYPWHNSGKHLCPATAELVISNNHLNKKLNLLSNEDLCSTSKHSKRFQAVFQTLGSSFNVMRMSPSNLTNCVKFGSLMLDRRGVEFDRQDVDAECAKPVVEAPVSKSSKRELLLDGANEETGTTSYRFSCCTNNNFKLAMNNQRSRSVEIRLGGFHEVWSDIAQVSASTASKIGVLWPASKYRMWNTRWERPTEQLWISNEPAWLTCHRRIPQKVSSERIPCHQRYPETWSGGRNAKCSSWIREKGIYRIWK